MTDWWPQFAASFLTIFLIFVLGAVTLSALLIVATFRRVKRLDLPDDAGFFTTLRAVPFLFALGLDLLDFALDFLATPICWLVLDRLGLKGLRDKASLEMLIPFTQPIPVMSLGWLLARFFGWGDAPPVPTPAPRPQLPPSPSEPTVRPRSAPD